MQILEVRTERPSQLIDITREIQEVARKTGATSGAVTVFVPHTTAAVTINENADPDVVRDILMEIDKIVPLQDGYRHGEGNSAAHIKSSLFGPSLTVILEDGRLQLGTWQGIYFCEFDGPRKRKVWVQVAAG